MERETRIIPEKQKGIAIEKVDALSSEIMEEAITLFCNAYNGMPPWYELYTQQESRTKMEGYQKKEGFKLFCARIEGRPVGMAIVADSNTQERRFLEEIFVDPSYWNSTYKVGSTLLAEVIKDSACSGYKAVELQTDCRNEAAVGLYKKFGFSESQKPEEKQITKRIFTKRLDMEPGAPDKPLSLPQPPSEPDSCFFLNSNELKQFLFWQWSKPDVPENKNIFMPLLNEVAEKALRENMIQKIYYNCKTEEWSPQKTDRKGILVNASTLDRLSNVTRFLLSLQKLIGVKINGNELKTLVDRCFSAQNGNRLNFICFVCASYEPDFSRVSLDAKANRLKFFEEDIRKIEMAMEEFAGNTRLTLFFADTDYEIYPIKPSEENIDNYKRQYKELRKFCEQFNPLRIRILPWSRYRSKYKDLYSKTVAKAQEISNQNVIYIPALNKEARKRKAKQMADYAAQAAILPINSVLLIMEPPVFNSDYDLLFKRQAIPTIPKLQSFDVDNYKNWIGQT